MSQSLLLVIIASVGTLALVGAAFGLGLSKSLTIASQSMAEKAVAAYDPDAQLHSVDVATDRRTALVSTKTENIFLVRALGDGLVVRPLPRSQIAIISAKQVRVMCNDLGCPDFDFVSEGPILSIGHLIPPPTHPAKAKAHEFA